MSTKEITDENLYLAMIAEQCARYEEMIEYLKIFSINKRKALTTEERNLLSIGYTKLIYKKRITLSKVNELEEIEIKNPDSEYSTLISKFKKEIESNLVNFCKDVILFMDELLKKNEEKTDDCGLAFYKKMKGDYFRYMSETKLGKTSFNCIERAEAAYEEAKCNVEKINILNTIPLGFYLNYSVFYYEVKRDQQKALRIIEEVLDKIKKNSYNVNNIDADDSKDMNNIINTLKENYELWKKESKIE